MTDGIASITAGKSDLFLFQLASYQYSSSFYFYYLLTDTIWGAMRGLESFAQLTFADYTAGTVIVSPYTIEDMPRYPFRGLMIDTSRHWLDVDMIIACLDTMASVKFNVLMWHVIDDQSFPLIHPSISAPIGTDFLYLSFLLINI